MLNLAKRVNHWVWDPNEERKRLERWQQEQERLLQVLKCNDMYAHDCEKTKTKKKTGDCYCLCVYMYTYKCVFYVCTIYVSVIQQLFFFFLSGTISEGAGEAEEGVGESTDRSGGGGEKTQGRGTKRQMQKISFTFSLSFDFLFFYYHGVFRRDAS